LRKTLDQTGELAREGQLPDVELSSAGLKISPLENSVPKEADALRELLYGMLPHLKVTDLLMEVDRWTRFTGHFVHLKTQDPAKDPALLLTAILADATNLGLAKMAESCPGTSLAKLSWLVAWHIRDETYSKALAGIVNRQHRIPFAAHWGEGTTASSDGQCYRAGGRAEAAGQVNARYGNDPSVTFYTHVSDQYAPFHTKVINATVRDATHVLDGLLYHESDLRIEEHYTDTAGFTDHVFALCHLLGFRFAPRIRDLADKRLYVPGKAAQWPTLGPLIGGSIRNKLIEEQFSEVLRLAASIQQGTVTASLILRKLGAYPRQNSLALGCAKSAESNGRCSRSRGLKIQLYAVASRRGSTRAKLETRSPERCSSTASARSVTAPLKTSNTAQAVSIWLSPPSRSGIRSIWNAPPPCSPNQGPSTPPCCSMSLRSAGSTSISLAIIRGAPINGSPKAASGSSETPEPPPPALSVRKFPFLEVSPSLSFHWKISEPEVSGGSSSPGPGMSDPFCELGTPVG